MGELVASLALATDLALGHPLEQGLGTCLVATRLARLAGAAPEAVRQTFHVALLRHIGCTTENAALAQLVGDEVAFGRRLNRLSGARTSDYMVAVVRSVTEDRTPIERIRAGGRLVSGLRTFGAAGQAICEVARVLAERLGYEPAMVHAVGTVYERWDGKGMPNRLRGVEIPLPVRVSQVADLATALHDLGEDRTLIVDVVRSRSGTGFDPDLVSLFEAHAVDVLAELDVSSRWDAVQQAAPRTDDLLEGGRLDDCLSVVADFADLKSPFLAGHSSGVARLARQAAIELRLPACEVDDVTRAALVHDIGRVSVSTAVWDKPGPLSAGDWEAVRLHPYQTGRVLDRAPYLSRLSTLATLHHERLDASGYYRGAPAPQIPPAARVLAAADAYHAMGEPRPHRPALTADAATAELDREVRAGRMDRETVDAVLAAAGRRVNRRKHHLSGLSAREVEVLHLLARGSSTKTIAKALVITPKTAANHVQSIYAKTGVTTRAAATVYAMQHGVLDPFKD
jgi:HD-GYP domain-containing protein (c-di-GMP phosphodiesterase class II)